MRGAAVTGPLLERSGELARIESALNQARSGSGRFVVVEGPAGIGKTSLLAAARTVGSPPAQRIAGGWHSDAATCAPLRSTAERAGGDRASAPPIYRVFQTGLLIQALTDQGELAAAEEALAAVDAEADRAALNATLLRFARGRLRLEQGRVAEGLGDFLAVGAPLVRAQVVTPSFLPWRSDAALAELTLGDRDNARRLANDELELALAFGTPRALGVAQRAAGLVAGGGRGEILLRAAVDAFQDAGTRLERARALADLGAMLRRRNRRTDARELLREALDIAHRAGAAPLAAHAETELRATGARPRRVVLTGLDSLTASERRIAELASLDLTNREIAQMLFITARTVEGHLTSVFRKLQLDSRNGLSAVLGNDVLVSA
jgi:DNA-binding CsgD family transcriptional regulator